MSTTPRLPKADDFPSSLALNIIPPSQNQKPINILILLHGLGDTHIPFTSLARSLNLPETCCLSLRAPTPIPAIFTGMDGGEGAWSWGDDVCVDEGRGELVLDGGFERARGVLGGVVEVLRERCEFPERNILMLGYGQGGMAALSYLSSLSSSSPQEEFGGVISIGGRLPPSSIFTSSSSSSSSKNTTPILVCGGSKSTEITRGAIEQLKAVFGEVEYVKWEKGEDSMPKNREETMPLMRFFGRRLRSRVGVMEGAVEI